MKFFCNYCGAKQFSSIFCVGSILFYFLLFGSTSMIILFYYLQTSTQDFFDFKDNLDGGTSDLLEIYGLIENVYISSGTRLWIGNGSSLAKFNCFYI
jgi:hypothetical protein